MKLERDYGQWSLLPLAGCGTDREKTTTRPLLRAEIPNAVHTPGNTMLHPGSLVGKSSLFSRMNRSKAQSFFAREGELAGRLHPENPLAVPRK